MSQAEWTPPGLGAFLEAQPFMAVTPSTSDWLRIEGDFTFTAATPGTARLTDTYRLEISIPPRFPNDIPAVKETGHRIPRKPDFHVNQDGTLCLGSPLRLMSILHQDPTVLGFSNHCLMPFLFAVSNGSLTGERFVLGELDHGKDGLLEDYQELLGLESSAQVVPALECLLKKKRIANKLPCPCGCGLRLGRCPFNETIRSFRKTIPRKWMRENFPKRL